ncbi:hypothetical protein [Fluviispira multicolorata]|uniref:Uncharacterized protein n=1 Tax=Fluviispira multicolorata TaxID=2654512 RepID=A0A833N4E5_9BACT|nr:hypothetical protein [Fluviispira multicolorata]KAB8027415.1 hypothetical protein GCL57_14560 [Fluviispira multicolorata]
MFRKNFLKIKFDSKYPGMIEKEFARSFLSAWLSVEEDLRPEEFYFAERSKIKFVVSELGVEGLVNGWPRKCKMFRRKTKPKFDGMIGYYKNANCLTVFLTMGQKSEFMIRLYKLLLNLFKANYGRIQSNEVEIKRNWFYKDFYNATQERRCGTNVNSYDEYGLGFRIPQLSWVNYLGKDLVERIGEDKFKTLEAYQVEKINDGYLIITNPSHRVHGTEVGYAEEERIMQHLGRQHFFDRNLIDLNILWADYYERDDNFLQFIDEIAQQKK